MPCFWLAITIMKDNLMPANLLHPHDAAFAEFARIIAPLPEIQRLHAERRLLSEWGALFFQYWQDRCAVHGWL